MVVYKNIQYIRIIKKIFLNKKINLLLEKINIINFSYYLVFDLPKKKMFRLRPDTKMVNIKLNFATKFEIFLF